MKKIMLLIAITLSTLLSPLSSWAIGVGTQTDYDVTLVANNTTTRGTLSYTITAYDEVLNKYKVRFFLVLGSINETQENWTDARQVTLGEIVFPQCVVNGGAYEDINVPYNNNIRTCKVISSRPEEEYEGKFWVAQVPFGIVKAVETEPGQVVTTELRQVTNP